MIVEQALALAQEFEEAADSASDGQVLDRCERVALDSGRTFLRQAEDVEKKEAPGGPAPVARRNKGGSSRRVVTAPGPLEIRRSYFTCPACSEGGYPLDTRLGVEGALSRQARRILCWAGGRMAFAVAAEALEELCGFSLSDETIRRACQAEAPTIAAWGATAEAARSEFRRADGLPEFQTDAAKVNTETVWLDVKIGVFAKREAGDPATSAEWDSRKLPPTTARSAFTAIETSEEFGARWRPWAARLEIDEPARLSVLADGAEWIWDRAAAQFPGSAEFLDIYHACEHWSDVAKALFGARTEAADAWLDGDRSRLLAAELRVSAAHRSVDRQRDDRGRCEGRDRQAAEEDRSAVVCQERAKDGPALLPDLQRWMEGVLG